MLDKDDRFWMLTAIILPLVAWWVMKGHKKYNVKGLTKNG